ncbi:MAG: LPS-assembly protein LptD [Sulfurimicrobium sp.]|nr:LPS-assembly protein LptD [Sulfurimicrobium sp.]
MRPLPLSLAALALLVPPIDLRAEDDALDLRPQTSLISIFPADEQTPIFLDADRMSGHRNVEIQADGECELRKRGRVINADSLIYNQAEDEVHAQGNVRIEQNGNVTTGPELKMKLETQQGYMREPVYTLQQPVAHGAGAHLEFLGKNRQRLTRGTYTTCAEGNNDWFLRVGELELDRTTQTGTAYHASIFFKGVPFLYTPWMDFPLDDRRKSGFLSPSFGSSVKSGAEFALPYYWNIAPEQDATLTPRILWRRGLQLSGEYRYLNPMYSGQTRAEVLPNDSLAGQGRHALSLLHMQNFGAGWAGSLNLQKVSDDNYFRDLTTTLASTSQVNLPRQGVLSYNGHGLSFMGRVLSYQTLQDPLAPVVKPYSLAPQLLVNGLWRNFPAVDLGLTGEWADFRHSTRPNGKRLTFYPNVTMPLQQSFAYVTPKLGMHMTRYTLGENNVAGLPDATRTLPIFSVDSGLFFERDMQLRDREFIQTLEPRLYYLYVPYRDQSRLPIFDTGLADFNYAQMFSENQFVGGDRINDANQVTAALTTRLLDPESGQERIRGTIGQRYYFKPQQVTLDGSAGRTDQSSDILAAFSGRLTPFWNVDAGVQYNTGQQQFQKTGVGVRYQPAVGKVLNLGYRFTRDMLYPIEQLDFSAQWPLGGRWQGVGRWNYSLQDSKILEGLAGLEYNGGCWAARVVMHRLAIATAQTNNSILFQLELFGMGKIGSNPLNILKRNISGYAPTLQSSTPATTYDPF